MLRYEMQGGRYVVRFDGTETKIDIVGKLTKRQIRDLVQVLTKALFARANFDGAAKGRVFRSMAEIDAAYGWLPKKKRTNKAKER